MIFFSTMMFFMVCKTAAHDKKNIILIIADDLGWNGVSYHGDLTFATPNIDTLATDGVRFENYYVQPICTPSRAALMTGKYPIRLGLQHDVIRAEAPFGLPLSEKILPEYLKDFGYVTRGVGKWHLGFFKEEYLPTKRGFDSFFGYYQGKIDYFKHNQKTSKGNYGKDLHDNENNAYGYHGKYVTDIFTEKAVGIIHTHNQSQPLFLYLAHKAVHTGPFPNLFQAPSEDIERFSHIKDHDSKVLAAMTWKLDESIGEVFSALNKVNMTENTVIIFTTDNGGAVFGAQKDRSTNWPLRGSKFSLWEGGVRGVSFMWSDELRRTNASQKCKYDLMHIVDWLPTIYAIAGGDNCTLPDIDGVNQLTQLTPSADSQKPQRSEVLLNIDPKFNVEALRRGVHKIIKGTIENGQYDSWFSLEGGSNKREDEQREKDLEKIYEQMAANATVRQILKENYYKNENFPKLEVNFVTTVAICGNRTRSSKNRHCNPAQAACLFDIAEDPCEMRNIADEKSEVVTELEKALEKYRKEAKPILNVPDDPDSNPDNFMGFWKPWK